MIIFCSAVTIIILGCSDTFSATCSDSTNLTRSAMTSTGIAEVVSVTGVGVVSALSISFGTSVVLMHLGLCVKTLIFFVFGALADTEAATFLFLPCF
jgi:hypothetical protein